MNWAGNVRTAKGPLGATTRGVGIYYGIGGGGLPDWEPRGYKNSVVGDPAGTLLLVEQPNGRNICGNDWPSFSAGPGLNFPSGLNPECVQISVSTLNYGAYAYGLHSKRFNYLFHDGHTEILQTQDTVGTGTTNAPKGMWTVIRGD